MVENKILLDRRTLVNGKTSSLNLDNYVELYTKEGIEEYIATQLLASSSITRVVTTGETSLTILAAEWVTLGVVPTYQVIDTTTGNQVDITPTYVGMVAPDYIPTSIVFNFGAGLPNDFLIVLK